MLDQEWNHQEQFILQCKLFNTANYLVSRSTRCQVLRDFHKLKCHEIDKDLFCKGLKGFLGKYVKSVIDSMILILESTDWPNVWILP